MGEHAPRVQYTVVPGARIVSPKSLWLFSAFFVVVSPPALLLSTYSSGVETLVPVFIACQLTSPSNLQKLLSLLLIQVQEILKKEDWINGQLSLQ